MAFIRRLGAWLFQVLISLDQLGLLLVQLVTYVIAGRGGAPNADETISSKVGRNAIRGARWALICEGFIDAIFKLVANQDDHCRRAVEENERPVKSTV
jgi:hypothetical protein